MDTVILAGGRNERLQPAVPAYMKPLIVVNGETLLGRLVRQTWSISDNVVVVCAGENAGVITQLLRDTPCDIVVKYDLAASLEVGARVARSDELLVLMSDNYVPDNQMQDFCRRTAEAPYAIGVRAVRGQAAARFTRLLPGAPVGGRWVESKDAVVDDVSHTVWCGPVMASRRRVLDALRTRRVGAYRIGPLLDELVDPARCDLVHMHVIDVGTPEVVTAVTCAPDDAGSPR